MNLKKLKIYIVLVTLFLQGCAIQAPDHDMLGDDLDKGLSWRPIKESLFLTDVFYLSDYAITNSLLFCPNKHNCKSLIEFKVTLISKIPFYFSYQCLGVYNDIPAWCPKDAEWTKVDKSVTFDIKGKAHYIYYERGWKIDQFEAPIKYKDDEVSKIFIPKIVLKDNARFF